MYIYNFFLHVQGWKYGLRIRIKPNTNHLRQTIHYLCELVKAVLRI